MMNAAANCPANDEGVRNRESATRLMFTAFVMSSRHMSTSTALFLDRAPNSPMQNSRAASAMNATGPTTIYSSPPDHHTAPTSAMSRTTEAISNGSAHCVNRRRPNSAMPGVTAGAWATAGRKDAMTAPAATSTASAIPAAGHDRSSGRSASSRWRRVSMTVKSSRTVTAPAYTMICTRARKPADSSMSRPATAIMNSSSENAACTTLCDSTTIAAPRSEAAASTTNGTAAMDSGIRVLLLRARGRGGVDVRDQDAGEVVVRAGRQLVLVAHLDGVEGARLDAQTAHHAGSELVHVAVDVLAALFLRRDVDAQDVVRALLHADETRGAFRRAVLVEAMRDRPTRALGEFEALLRVLHGDRTAQHLSLIH